MFIGITAAVAVVVGDHPLPTRIVYQMIVALAVFIALVLIAWRVRSAAAVAIVGLNPVTAYMVVNAGHNDALVGLGILVGVLLASRERHTWATLAFTAAALVKATAGLALVVYLLWLAYRRGPRALVRPVGVAIAVAVPMLLVACASRRGRRGARGARHDPAARPVESRRGRTASGRPSGTGSRSRGRKPTFRRTRS